MDENIGFEEQLLEALPEQDGEIVRSFATVGGVYADGLSLIFDGEEEETQKHYLCNTSATFAAGDRVKLATDSGTYIVEYVVGPPGTAPEAHGLPAGGAADQVLTKTSATDYDAAWANIPDPPHELPSGGSNNQVLTKNGSTDYAVKWANVPDPAHELPTGGTSGQVLTKDGSTNYAVKWSDAPIAQNVHNYGAAAASVIWLQFDATNGRLRVSLDHANWRNLNFD